jgi:hypothetical protein
MKQTGHNDLVVLYDEVDSVGKSSDQATPEFFVRFSIKEGIARYIAGAGIEHAKKFIA